MNTLKQKIISPKKRGTLTEPLKLTEPHYIFCVTQGFVEPLLKSIDLVQHLVLLL